MVFTISSTQPVIFAGSLRCALANSAFPEITVNALRMLWANLWDNWPIAAIFCEWSMRRSVSATAYMAST